LVAHAVIHGTVRCAGFAFGDVGRAAIDFDRSGGHVQFQIDVNFEV
jgi:hypothetical protein